MTTRFHWVRHGPTHEKAMVGWRDVAADLSNHDQIDRLNRILPDQAVVFASDLIRASATADRLGRTRMPDDARLREFDFGDWDGVAFDVIAQRDPDVSMAYWDTPGDVSPPGGESWNRAAARIDKAVVDIGQAHKGKDIIIVAHFGTILTQVQRALDCAPHQAMKFKIDNLSVTSLVDYGDTWGVQRINHVP
ncbi:MAG: histidine phosphatase family protein [Pseudomonadota bacterium]